MFLIREIFWASLLGCLLLSITKVNYQFLVSFGWTDIIISILYLLSILHLKIKKRMVNYREERRNVKTRFNSLMFGVWLLWSLIYFILFWIYWDTIIKENFGILLFFIISLIPKFTLLLSIIIVGSIVFGIIWYRRRHPADEHVRGRGLDFIGSDTLIEVLANSSFLESEDSCAICLEKYQEGDELRKMPCSHSFHRSCVDHWLESRTTCPYCRMDLRSGGENLVHSIGREGETQV